MIVALDSPHLTRRYEVVRHPVDDPAPLVEQVVEQAKADPRAEGHTDEWVRAWVTVDGSPWP